VLACSTRAGHIRARWALIAILAWCLATAPYSSLVLSELWRTGDVAAVAQSATVGTFGKMVLNTSLSSRMLLLSLAFFVYNFPGLTLPLAAYGGVRRGGVPRLLHGALLAELAIFGLFVGRYSIADQYSFYFPIYALLAVFAGLGVARVLDWPAARRRRAVLALAFMTSLWTPILYPAVAAWLRASGRLSGLLGAKPYRDGYREYFVPWGLGADGPTRLIEDVAAHASADALVVLADHMQGFALRYGQLVGRLPASLQMIELSRHGPSLEELRASMRQRLDRSEAVILVPRDRARPEAPVPGPDWDTRQVPIAGAQWERAGDLYILRGLHDPSEEQDAD
jgi:hypothetical protein